MNIKNKFFILKLLMGISVLNSDTVFAMKEEETKTDYEIEQKLGLNLIVAIQKDDLSLAKNIISLKKVNLNFKHIWDRTPLMGAALRGHKEIVEMLLKYKVDVNNKDFLGCTALDLATTDEIRQLIQDHKCVLGDIFKKNQYKNVLLEILKNLNVKDIKNLLLLSKDLNKNSKEAIFNMLSNFNILKNLSYQKLKNYRSTSKESREKIDNAFALALKKNKDEISFEQRKKEAYELGLVLIDAIKNGNLDLAKDIINFENSELEVEDKNRKSALILACDNGYKDIVKMLLDHGVKTTKWKYHDIFGIIENGDVEIMDMILKAGIDVNSKCYDGETAFMNACCYNPNLKIVKLLLNHKDIDVNPVDNSGDEFFTNGTPLTYCSRNGDTEMVKLLLSHEDVYVNYQDRVIVDDEGYNDDYFYDGATGLMWASLEGHGEIVKMLLIHRDINVNIKGSICEALSGVEAKYGSDGYTALMWAIVKGRKEIVRMILEHEDIDVDVISHGVMYESDDTIDSDDNSNSEDGETALILASIYGDKEIVEMLLKADADVYIKNNEGKTALDLAASDEIRKLIQDHIDKESKKRKRDDLCSSPNKKLK